MVRKIHDVQVFLSLLKNFNVSTNAYMSYEYYEVYCRYYNPENRFICFVVEDDNANLLALFPLVKRIFDYVILGYRASNYLGYICKDNDCQLVDQELKAYFEYVKPSMIITYYDIYENSELFNVINNDILAKKIFLYECPYCEVDCTFDHVFNRQITKAKKRTELKKFQRKLTNLGEVKILNIDSEEDWEEGKKYFPEIFNVHAERFDSVYISKDLCLHKNIEYYSELFANMVRKGKAYISIMLLDNQVISFVYALVSNGKIIDWMPAFDPAFAKYNLGTVHLMNIIEYVCSKDTYTIFDFSKGRSVYKDRWSNCTSRNYMFVRRYRSQVSDIIIQACISIPYITKSWLRENGILSMIKNCIVKENHPNRKNGTSDQLEIEIVKNSEIDQLDNITKFKYALIKNMDSNARKQIIDEVYNGNNVYLRLKPNRIIAYIVNPLADSK